MWAELRVCLRRFASTNEPERIPFCNAPAGTYILLQASTCTNWQVLVVAPLQKWKFSFFQQDMNHAASARPDHILPVILGCWFWHNYLLARSRKKSRRTRFLVGRHGTVGVLFDFWLFAIMWMMKFLLTLAKLIFVEAQNGPLDETFWCTLYGIASMKGQFDRVFVRTAGSV